MHTLAKTELPSPRAIIDRRALLERLDGIAKGKPATEARPLVLAVFKEALADGRAEIRRRFDADRDARTRGVDCARAYAYLIDQIIRSLYDFAFEQVYPNPNPTAGERKAVVATGGYGRGELAPQSDIDLLFLLAYKLTPHAEQVIEYMLYMLWDLGLKVGHATRSVDECIRMAKQDQTIRTALLEARYLWGDAGLYRELRTRFRELAAAEGPISFVEKKLAERDERHEKVGDSRYMVEPNIKDGKGGLRDLQTLYWIAKYIYQLDDPKDLVEQGVFTRREAAKFDRAHAFLTTVRCHLHYLAGRPEERLTFDVQPRLGKLMGYRDRPGALGVERFMKHYYLVAKDVGDLTRIFCAALEAEHKRKPRFRFGLLPKKREIEGFVVQEGRITVAGEEAFLADPVNFIRLFHAAQEHDLDIHPAALRLITQQLGAIDAALRENPEANRLFLEMLTSKNDPATALTRLNEAGVFGRFVPDFGRVVALMQHDMYHVYTVDEHTIRSIRLLHEIDTGKMKEEHPLASEIVHKVASRRALYVAVFLHDIAKGRGGDHSEIGADIAKQLGPRFGLTPEETENVSWLVLHHLDMSKTAQKRDIDDPKTIGDFAAFVQSPERLKLLLVLTVVDMRATSPKIWNNWKASLLRELYYRTEERLAGSPTGANVAARVDKAKEALVKRLSGWSVEDIEQHLARGYPAYWLSDETETQLRHAELVRAAVKSGEQIAVYARHDPGRDVTEFTVYTPDHAGLFSQIAGVMALSRANVVDARIFTFTNGWALDTFYIQDMEGRPIDDEENIERLKRRLAAALTGTIKLDRELAGRESLPKRAHVFQVPPRVFVDNAASRFATVIEVNGRDRPGLLYDVTRALTDCGLQITTAKISTFGERVVDVFYVKDVFGMKVEHERKLEQVKAKLLEALAGVDAAKTERAAA
ncbi:MAG: [protein-PII] uridylyltransferase [Rhodospirillaceae bacterium]|nr:[protein-PII] uridylyltransferase [Rhodospirillaceae bacterium]